MIFCLLSFPLLDSLMGQIGEGAGVLFDCWIEVCLTWRLVVSFWVFVLVFS